MARIKRNSKTTSVHTENGTGILVDQTDQFDDNPLPDAEELARYQKIDPEIVSWLIYATEKEQDHRHRAELLRLREVRSIHNRLFAVDFIRVCCAFIIVLSGMGFSYILIREQRILPGSVFAGATMLSAVAMFLNLRTKARSDT